MAERRQSNAKGDVAAREAKRKLIADIFSKNWRRAMQPANHGSAHSKCRKDWRNGQPILLYGMTNSPA